MTTATPAVDRLALDQLGIDEIPIDSSHEQFPSHIVRTYRFEDYRSHRIWLTVVDYDAVPGDSPMVGVWSLWWFSDDDLELDPAHDANPHHQAADGTLYGSHDAVIEGIEVHTMGMPTIDLGDGLVLERPAASQWQLTADATARGHHDGDALQALANRHHDGSPA